MKLLFRQHERSCIQLLLYCFLALAWDCPRLTAAVANVSIVDYAFSPATVTINVKDQVKWTWQGYYHSTTSSTGLWDSGVNNTGYTYSFTFNNAGSYPYMCSYHYFTGSVVVQAAANSPPTIAITSPTNGAVLSAPASLTLQATAADSDGSVTNVQFFQGAASLGSAQTAPYSIAVSALSAANYTFSAVATDNGGLTATNSITVKVITPSPDTLGSLKRLSSTSFQFTYAADVGLRYQVEQSSDLRNWTSVSTNTATSNQVLFQDTTASGSSRFYRVERLPNP
jgi:plastocyanin